MCEGIIVPSLFCCVYRVRPYAVQQQSTAVVSSNYLFELTHSAALDLRDIRFPHFVLLYVRYVVVYSTTDSVFVSKPARRCGKETEKRPRHETQRNRRETVRALFSTLPSIVMVLRG